MTLIAMTAYALGNILIAVRKAMRGEDPDDNLMMAAVMVASIVIAAIFTSKGWVWLCKTQ